MRELNKEEVEQCSGGMKWEGGRESDNVVDRRGFFSTNSRTGEILWGDTWNRYF